MNLAAMLLRLVAKVEDLPASMQPSVTRLPTYYLTDILVIVGGAVILMVGLILWVVFVRGSKQPGNSRRIYKYSDDPNPGSVSAHGHHRRKKKHKRRRREHRGRNPTLSQTGGLPPAGSEENSSAIPNPGPTS